VPQEISAISADFGWVYPQISQISQMGTLTSGDQRRPRTRPAWQGRRRPCDESPVDLERFIARPPPAPPRGFAARWSFSDDSFEKPKRESA
jgi:hypothetical protein